MTRPRVMFDTNVFVSFLLTAGASGSIIQRLFDQASSVDFELIVPEAVLLELLEKARNKPALTSRISEEAVLQFEAWLRATATVTPLRELEIAAIVRDPDDDYIVAYAIDDRADYLISGDKDLLALGDSLAPLKIRSPQAFIDEVEREPLPGVD